MTWPSRSEWVKEPQSPSSAYQYFIEGHLSGERMVFIKCFMGTAFSQEKYPKELAWLQHTQLVIVVT